MDTPTRRANDLLASFLAGSALSDPEASLTGLVLDHALPAIRKVVGRRLAGAPAEQQEDVAGEAVAALIARLRALRLNPAASPAVADFLGYACGVAENAVHQHIASRSPERSRLRRRIRMVCAADRRFLIWETAGGAWLCGAAGTREKEKRATAAELDECRQELASTRLPSLLPDLMAAIFQRLTLPVELNDLLFLCVGLLGIGGSPDDLQRLEDRLADPRIDAGRRTDNQAWMEHLWKEIGELPERQRHALLLHLREPGGAAIGLFEDLGVAGSDQLAAALSITVEELAGLWVRLPLSDNDIAERLGVGRQQVINLRSAARQRLARRMKGYE